MNKLLTLLFAIGIYITSFSQKSLNQGIYYSVGAGGYLADNKDAQFFDGRSIRSNSIVRVLNNSYTIKDLQDILNDELYVSDDGNLEIDYAYMRYRPSFSLNGQLGYKMAGRVSFFGELFFSRLMSGEAMYLRLASPPQGADAYKDNRVEGSIVSKEQRTDFYLGGHYMFADEALAHAFIETGVNVTNTKVLEHTLTIESFERNLMYTDLYQNYVPNKDQGGTGVGYFFNLGYQLPLNDMFTAQVLAQYAKKDIKLLDEGLSNYFTLFTRFYF